MPPLCLIWTQVFLRFFLLLLLGFRRKQSHTVYTKLPSSSELCLLLPLRHWDKGL